jgi:hypothetical protein
MNMMLKKIINPLHHPNFRYCTGSKIWDKDVNKMVQLDLLLIFVRVKNELGHEMAQKAVDLIVKKVTEAYQTLEIKNLNIISQKMIRPVITLGEITSFMACLSFAKRRAFLFSLLTGMSPIETSKLTWKQIYTNIKSYPDDAVILAESMARYITCPFVFYERGMPLIELETEFKLVTKMRWNELKERFDNLIYIDSNIEAQEFMKYTNDKLN